MGYTPEYKVELEHYRESLKDMIRKLADDVSGPLPRTYLDDSGCRMKAFVNYGEVNFSNIGRIYEKCVTTTHGHRHINHITEAVDDDSMKAFTRLRALYEISGKKYSSVPQEFSTEVERMDVLATFFNRAVMLCHMQTVRHSNTGSDSTPDPADDALPASSLGKRSRDSEEIGSGRAGKRRRIQPFPCPSPLMSDRERSVEV
ncbi:hypothetical protein VNI00_018799 [Paramarasmius palmivorus]|uniref:Uncharacterized protein n=1 Tax=Paramarasmius palmivorus TaxID=297713 RepID=A0AAW0AVL7_9AGAR